MPSSHRFVRGLFFLSALAALGVGAVASPAPLRAAPKGWSLPEGAREVAPDVWEIGTKEVNGRTLTGYAILDYGHGHEAKGGKPGGGGGGGTTTSGYAYIASGFKWKPAKYGLPYVVDPSLSSGDATMTADYVRQVVAESIADWEDAAADGIVGNGTSVDIFGDETIGGTVDRTKLGKSSNQVNEVAFGPIAQAGVIAVTFVFGPSGGPPGGREILEWDQIYDDDTFTWSDVETSHDTTDMDFSNIAHHEIGHAFGMDHPSSTYAEETMHASAGYGEVKKRSLEIGDRTGINLLY